MESKQAILHCVFLKVKDGHETAFDQAMSDLQAVVGSMAEASDLRHGRNADFEQMSPGYSHGFAIRFESSSALEVYADDARHKAIGARLVDMSTGGKAGLMVFDLITD